MYDRVIKDDRAFIFWLNYPFKHCVRGRGLFWILKVGISFCLLSNSTQAVKLTSSEMEGHSWWEVHFQILIKDEADKKKNGVLTWTDELFTTRLVMCANKVKRVHW